jgi:hypothetical protein
MRFLVVLLCVIYAFGMEANIENVNKNIVTLNKPVTKGVSGVVLCPYEGKEIICARAVSLGKKAELKIYDNLKNDAFALPVVSPKKGDKIIFGKNYDRILIIAPNQEEYLKVKNRYKNATVISSDNFAAVIDDIPTKKDFVNFAKKLDIGRIVFVLDKIYEVDAYSFYAVKKYGNVSAKYNKIFFTTYPDFDLQQKKIISYYKKLIKE